MHFLSWKCILSSNITIGQKGSGKLLSCTQRQALYCLVFFAIQTEKMWILRKIEPRLGGETQGKPVKQFETQFWMIYVAIPTLGKLKKTKDRIQIFSGTWKGRGLRTLFLFAPHSWCISWSAEVTTPLFLLSIAGGSLAMWSGELSVSSAVGWGLFFVGEKWMYEAYM